MKVVFYCNANSSHGLPLACQRFEVPDDELEGLSEIEKDNLITEYLEDWVWEISDPGFEVITEDGKEE